jgi:hypothetical protein
VTVGVASRRPTGPVRADDPHDVGAVDGGVAGRADGVGGAGRRPRRDEESFNPAHPERGTMTVEDILTVAEEIGDADERRRTLFERELEAIEAGEGDGFPETRSRIERERELLAELDEHLAAERDEIDAIVDRTEFLSVDQAVEHREKSIEKLTEHNRRLQEFHDAMVDALDVVESNVDQFEAGGFDAVEGDAEPHFERAHEALEAHNEAVAGLKKNMTILNAYLV